MSLLSFASFEFDLDADADLSLLLFAVCLPWEDSESAVVRFLCFVDEEEEEVEEEEDDEATALVALSPLDLSRDLSSPPEDLAFEEEEDEDDIGV